MGPDLSPFMESRNSCVFVYLFYKNKQTNMKYKAHVSHLVNC